VEHIQEGKRQRKTGSREDERNRRPEEKKAKARWSYTTTEGGKGKKSKV